MTLNLTLILDLFTCVSIKLVYLQLHLSPFPCTWHYYVKGRDNKQIANEKRERMCTLHLHCKKNRICCSRLASNLLQNAMETGANRQTKTEMVVIVLILSEGATLSKCNRMASNVPERPERTEYSLCFTLCVCVYIYIMQYFRYFRANILFFHNIFIYAC